MTRRDKKSGKTGLGLFDIAGLCILTVLTAAIPIMSGSAAEAATQSNAIDHQLLTRVLERVVHDGRIDYLALRSDRSDLDRYVDQIGIVDAGTFDSEKDRLAFWLNAYNAIALKSVLDNWPLASIRDVPGFLTKRRHRVSGEAITLQEIMNVKLRDQFSDPRVLFGTVWGCVGCAPLPTEAYYGDRVDDQLDKAVNRVLRDERYVKVDASAGIVYLPEFVKWYAADFRTAYGSPIQFVKKYSPEKFMESSGVPRSLAVSYTPFDWDVNIARLPER